MLALVGIRPSCSARPRLLTESMALVKGKSRQRRVIDHERFVKEWTLAQSIEQVCERMALPRHIVNSTAKKLRDQGVKLKAMRRTIVDVSKLNKIIEETETP